MKLISVESELPVHEMPVLLYMEGFNRHTVGRYVPNARHSRRQFASDPGDKRPPVFIERSSGGDFVLQPFAVTHWAELPTAVAKESQHV